MKEITSLFDFFAKVKRDKRYESVAVKAYQESGGWGKRRGGWTEAKNWLDNWIEANIDSDCSRMVNYLNRTMMRLPKWQDETLSEPRLDIPEQT